MIVVVLINCSVLLFASLFYKEILHSSNKTQLLFTILSIGVCRCQQTCRSFSPSFLNELAYSKATKPIGLVVCWPLESESVGKFSGWISEISNLKSKQLSCLARLWYLHNTIIFMTAGKMEFKRVWYLYRLKNEKGHYIVRQHNTTYYIPHPACSSKFYWCHNPRLHLVRWVSSPPPHLHNLLYEDNADFQTLFSHRGCQACCFLEIISI